MTPAQIAFLFLAAFAVAGAVGVVVLKNPVQAALSLVLNFFVLAFLYFTLGAQLLGITQIMVYAGAIMVLFLFVIMILKSQQVDIEKRYPDRKPLLAVLFGAGFAVVVLQAVIAPTFFLTPTTVPDVYGTPQAIGRVLFTTYALPFEVTSLLLLIGIVGSVLLAKRRLG